MESIKDGLPQLLLGNMQRIKEFHANTYKDSFNQMYDTYKPLFLHIEESYQDAEDKKAFVLEIAEDFVQKVKVQYEKEHPKKNQGSAILDYNMMMTSFVVPCILEFRGDFSDPLVEQMLSVWNQTFDKYKLQKGTFSDIDGAFKRKLCYITTAVCESLGKQDNCYELTALRAFRDTYMMQHAEGQTLVNQYYDTAPNLVMRMNQHKEAEQIYAQIYKQYINPCISYIEADEYQACEEKYVEMVNSLTERYMQTE